MAFRAVWMFLVEVAQGGCDLLSWIPRYVVDWVMVANFTPCRSNSLGTLRDNMFVSALSVPSLARRSLDIIFTITAVIINIINYS